jgi:hypothetical protein
MNLSSSKTTHVGRLRYHSDDQERNNEGWLPGRGQFVLDKLIIDISVDEPLRLKCRYERRARSLLYTRNTGKDAAEKGQ